MFKLLLLFGTLNHQRKQQKKDVAKMTHSTKVYEAKIRSLQERIEYLETEISILNVDLTLLKFGTKNYKNFKTENFDINDYV